MANSRVLDMDKWFEHLTKRSCSPNPNSKTVAEYLQQKERRVFASDMLLLLECSPTVSKLSNKIECRQSA